MKIEVNIHEEEIKELLKQRVLELASTALRSSDISWRINEQIKSSWHAEIDEMVKQRLSDIPMIESEIRSAMRRKLMAQLNKLMNKESET